MDWQEVKIYTTTEGIEPITGALMEIGINGFMVEDANDFEQFIEESKNYYDCIDDELMKLKDCESSITVFVKKDVQGYETLNRIKSVVEILKNRDDIDFGRLDIELKDVFEEDWATAWKKYFKPVRISDYVVIKPTWEKVNPHEDDIVVELDPGMAFGTGTHETTKMCVKLIESLIEPNMSVLDVGCGSGILSVVAAKFGSERVLAVDTDAMCIKVTRENAEQNKCSDIIETVCGDLLENVRDEKFDIVVANIIADVIIRLNEDVSRFLKPDGVYICSGIIDSKQQMVVDSLVKCGFKIVMTEKMGDWWAFACKNRK